MKYSFPKTNKLDRVLFFMKLSFIVNCKNYFKTSININKNKNKKNRFLEVGPGLNRIKDFETINIIDSPIVDYIIDISEGKTPFENNTFDLIYCSHLIEHLPWYNVEKVLKEFSRILTDNGQLEIWVPDGYKICKVLVQFEEDGIDNTNLDGWYRFNEEKDPVKWTAGRLFTYGDGLGTVNHHNWHRGLFTEKYLKRLLSNVGFVDIGTMDNSEVRGYDHGWINLGIKGFKS
jgi:SAM-dependent methyltransferase